MKRWTWSLLLAGALAASAGVNLVLARALCTGCPLCERPSPAQLQDCIECIALSPEQRSSLLAQCASCCSEADTTEQRIATLNAELQRALRTVPLDAVAVRELGRELAWLRGEAITSGVEAALRMRSVLSAEQLSALDRSLERSSGGSARK